MSVHGGQGFGDFAAFKRAKLAWASSPDSQFSYRVSRNQSSRQSWLQQILPTTLPITKGMTSRQIIDAVALHHYVTINYEAAKKAKKLALGDDLIQQAEQFGRLPAYVDAQQAADPAAHTRLSIALNASSFALEQVVKHFARANQGGKKCL